MSLVKTVHELWGRKHVRQIASLFSVNILGLLLGIITNIIVTRYLGPELFGDYKFICSIFNFAALFATLGFFQSGNRVIVLSKNRGQTREYYGALLIILVILSVLMSLGLRVFAHFDNNLYDKGITSLFVLIIPLGFITLWGQLYETILPADNQIGLLAKIRLYPKVINLIFAFIFYLLSSDLQWNRLVAILLLYNGSQMLLYFYVALKTKPIFENCKESIKSILQCNKNFGLNVYIGSICAVGFGYLTEILISYFGVDNVNVGYYSLAVTLTAPLTFIPSTIATTHYKSFAGANGISKKLFLITISISAASVVALWIIIPPFIKYCYGEAFIPVIRINFFVCISVFLHGMADFYNRFIQANGCGARLRNASIVVGFSMLICNLLLIPSYGAYGAAYSRIIAGCVYMSIIYYYYRRTVKDIVKDE